MKAFSARDVEGFLLKSFDDSFVLRVYHSDDKSDFADYRIVHADLHVRIIDSDAVFRGETIDYSDQTLGHSNDSSG